jgi:uncharacterized protein (TIRG00374 family)
MLRAIKILVSVSLIAYLIYQVDWTSALAEIGQAEPVAVFLALLILFVQVLVSAWKWQISLTIHNLEYETRKLLRVLYIAFFFNNFLPTAVGGDIYRVYRTLPADGRKSKAVSALLLDRIVGLLSLLFIGGIGAAVIYARDGNQRAGVLFVALMLPVVFALVLPGLLRSSSFKLLGKKLARFPKLEPLVHNAKLILGGGRSLLHLLGASVLFQVLAIVAIILLFAAVHTTGIIAESAVVGAMYAIASLLPISINGIGVMEGSFALTAEQFGLGFDSAVIVALILRLGMVLLSLIGAVLFLFDKGRAADLDAIYEMDHSSN